MQNKFKSVVDGLELNNLIRTHIEIYDNNILNIEGCTGINEYSEECICVNMPKGHIIILGTNLFIKNMEEGCIVITGRINNIEFCGGKK